MKYIRKDLLKLSIRGQLLATKTGNKLKSTLQDNTGGVVAEQGTLTAGVVALIVVVIGLAIKFAVDTWFPGFGDKLMEIFNMK